MQEIRADSKYIDVLDDQFVAHHLPVHESYSFPNLKTCRSHDRRNKPECVQWKAARRKVRGRERQRQLRLRVVSAREGATARSLLPGHDFQCQQKKL